MTFEALLAATLFALASSITPGPNNTMLMTSGVNFGFRRSLRHLSGVQIGFWILLLATGLGLNTALSHFPGFYQGLRIAGTLYLLWMAYRLVSVSPHAPPLRGSLPPEGANLPRGGPSEDCGPHAPPLRGSPPPAPSQPMGFWAAVAFQWVNPKAWVMTVTCISTYLPPDASSAQLLTLMLMFVVVGLPCSVLWLGFGQAMRRWLQDPVRLRIFNVTMAIALVASLYPLLMN